MKLSESLQALGPVVAYYPSLAKIIGVKECVLVCQLTWWAGKQADPAGWIYKTQEEITNETGLARWEQETARKALKKLKILEEKENRLEHKLFYRINIAEIDALWNSVHIPESGNPASGKPGIQHPSKSTEYVQESICTPDAGKIDKQSDPVGCQGVYHKHSRTVLFYLNEKTGHHYRETDPNLKFISARLSEPEVDLDGIKVMIDRQVQEWKETEMEKYLRPETLFNRTKFDSYYASRLIPASKTHLGNHSKGFDRNKGTCNEGKSSQYDMRAIQAKGGLPNLVICGSGKPAQ